MKRVVCFLVVTSLMLQQHTEALECYECADCTIPYSSYFAKKVNCDSSSCMKMNITTKFNKIGIVSRGCSTVGFEAERCEFRHVSGTTSEICFCNEDECNSADVTKLTFTKLFAFLTSTILYFCL